MIASKHSHLRDDLSEEQHSHREWRSWPCLCPSHISIFILSSQETTISFMNSSNHCEWRQIISYRSSWQCTDFSSFSPHEKLHVLPGAAARLHWTISWVIRFWGYESLIAELILWHQIIGIRVTTSEWRIISTEPQNMLIRLMNLTKAGWYGDTRYKQRRVCRNLHTETISHTDSVITSQR